MECWVNKAQPNTFDERDKMPGGTSGFWGACLRDRGPNINAVANIEVSEGGDPQADTPYQVATYPVRSTAEMVVARFRRAGATADVVPADTCS
jgi:hypothetical protein